MCGPQAKRASLGAHRDCSDGLLDSAAGGPAAQNSALPLLVEGRTNEGTVLRCETTAIDTADEVIESCLAEEQIDFVFLRHGEAGCHIARIDRM